MIVADASLTAKAISEKMSKKDSVTERTIQNDLAQLKKMGILSREGGRKEGRWVIVNKQGDWREKKKLLLSPPKACWYYWYYRIIHLANTTCEHLNEVLPLKRESSAEKWDWKSDFFSKDGDWVFCEHQKRVRRISLCLWDVWKYFWCSHGVRKSKKKHLRNLRKCLIFSVDQPGLEPGTSRLWVRKSDFLW